MENLSQNYQELSREQAYGVQGRLLLRIFPLLRFKSDTSSDEIASFFNTLFEFCHALFDVSLGNLPKEDIQEKAKSWETFFHSYSSKFQPKSRVGLEPIMIILDAAKGNSQIIYFEKPGLASIDRNFPDIEMSVVMAGMAILEQGLKETVIFETVEHDCDFIAQNNTDIQYLEVNFFKRNLWTSETAIFSEIGMDYALENVIFKEWKSELAERGLTGVIASYEKRLRELHLKKIHQNDSNTNTVINNVTITLGDGATFTGPVNVGENIQSSFNIVKKSSKKDVKEDLEELIILVGKLIEQIPSDAEKEQVSQQLKSFVEEANKDKPNGWLVKASSGGILESAKTFVNIISPISTIIKNIIGIIG
jgi:hypothetical protein